MVVSGYINGNLYSIQFKVNNPVLKALYYSHCWILSMVVHPIVNYRTMTVALVSLILLQERPAGVVWTFEY